MTIIPNIYKKSDYLKDGREVVVRAVVTADKTALEEALKKTSRSTIRARFFYTKKRFSPEELDFLTNVDFDRHVAIGVELIQDSKLVPIGIGRYVVDKENNDLAEIAVTVNDSYQGLGVGTILVNHLTAIAIQHGIKEFSAYVLAENDTMLHILRRLELPQVSSTSEGITKFLVELPKPE